MADAISCKPPRSIAPIDTKGDVFIFEKSEDLGLLKIDEGPREGGSWPLKGRKPLLSGAANQVEEQGFSDIVHGVCRRDRVEAVFFSEAIEKTVPNIPKLLLDIFNRFPLRVENRKWNGP